MTQILLAIALKDSEIAAAVSESFSAGQNLEAIRAKLFELCLEREVLKLNYERND